MPYTAVNNNTSVVQIRVNQPPIRGPGPECPLQNHAVIRLFPVHLRGPQGSPDSRLFEYCITCKWAWVLSAHHYIMSLSRKLYFPKSLSFGAIRWSFLALASFIKRNSLRSIHSFSSCSPCASLHKSSSMHVPLRNLSEHKITCQPSETTGIRLVTRDIQRSAADNLTSHKLWKCLWEIDTASSSDHPQSWKLCLCVFLRWCAAATASHCCSSYHTANSDCQPAKTQKSHLRKWLITVCFLIIQIYRCLF